METECLNAALLNDGPQTNGSIRTSRQQLGEGRRGEGRGERNEGEDKGISSTESAAGVGQSTDCISTSPLHPRGPHTRDRMTQPVRPHQCPILAQGESPHVVCVATELYLQRVAGGVPDPNHLREKVGMESRCTPHSLLIQKGSLGHDH